MLRRASIARPEPGRQEIQLMLERCRRGSPLACGSGDSRPPLLVRAKLSHDSFSLQVDEIFPRRDRRQPSHSTFGFTQTFDRGNPKCVPILKSFEYVESVIHHSLLVVAI